MMPSGWRLNSLSVPLSASVSHQESMRLGLRRAGRCWISLPGRRWQISSIGIAVRQAPYRVAFLDPGRRSPWQTHFLVLGARAGRRLTPCLSSERTDSQDSRGYRCWCQDQHSPTPSPWCRSFFPARLRSRGPLFQYRHKPGEQAGGFPRCSRASFPHSLRSRGPLLSALAPCGGRPWAMDFEGGARPLRGQTVGYGKWGR